MVGRNGVFYDRKGRDWDATITKIVDNPISIRQAFWAPYKKAIRMVNEQIAKRAASADEAAVNKLTQTAANIEKAAAENQAQAAAAAQGTPPPPPPPPPPKKIDPGLIAALGVGAAGLGGMLGGIITGFLGLRWMMPVGVLAIILMISGPSMLLAWLRLRKRNLGPILDANGWAVNAKAKINVPFGASLTQVAALPPGAQRDQLVDPFADKKRPWGLYLSTAAALALVLGWVFGYLNGPLPYNLSNVNVLGLLRIEKQPQSQIVFPGANVTFKVQVTEASQTPLSYQWLESGQPILGATSDTCTLTNVSGDKDGKKYKVEIRNFWGTVRSHPSAILTVTNAATEKVAPSKTP